MSLKEIRDKNKTNKWDIIDYSNLKYDDISNIRKTFKDIVEPINNNTIIKHKNLSKGVR